MTRFSLPAWTLFVPVILFLFFSQLLRLCLCLRFFIPLFHCSLFPIAFQAITAWRVVGIVYLAADEMIRFYTANLWCFPTYKASSTSKCDIFSLGLFRIPMMCPPFTRYRLVPYLLLRKVVRVGHELLRLAALDFQSLSERMVTSFGYGGTSCWFRSSITARLRRVKCCFVLGHLKEYVNQPWSRNIISRLTFGDEKADDKG